MIRRIKIIIEDFDTGRSCEGIMTIANDEKHFPTAPESIKQDSLVDMVSMLNSELNFKLKQNIDILK